MSKASTGAHYGGREGSALENTGASIVSNIVQQSSEGCLIQSYGLPKHSFSMGTSTDGTGNFEWLVIIHISFYGKQAVITACSILILESLLYIMVHSKIEVH